MGESESEKKEASYHLTQTACCVIQSLTFLFKSFKITRVSLQQGLVPRTDVGGLCAGCC